MVEGTGLENRHTGEPGIVSSNLTLSALALGERLTPAQQPRFTGRCAGSRFDRRTYAGAEARARVDWLAAVVTRRQAGVT